MKLQRVHSKSLMTLLLWCEKDISMGYKPVDSLRCLALRTRSGGGSHSL